ncbi:YrhB domain-containing protein [Streptomyces sp. NBC_00091]|uniref:YrhB domain-containing protein n=1 Tax=Streptomyces sp. NBC_00091 TaxID=2975648 RepID=UPI002258077A|nr:YrhB domain-containing protein [Streptomyces sp. NBC_00091]MCX5378240.1 YrhB domain-containing protein [Streptomyces sp. NBC_00091]
MLTLNEAVEAARPYLEQAFSYGPWTLVLQPELSEEHELAWIIRIDSQESIDAGDPWVGPMEKMVLVPKDGAAVRFPPTHLPLDEYFAYVRHGGWDTAAKGKTSKAEPWQKALQWLLDTYHGLVELVSIEAVAEDAGTWLFACRTIEQPGYPRTPMLAASVVVPKTPGRPFHPASDDPWGDVAAYTRAPAKRDPEVEARRLNSRGCVVTVAAAIAGAPSTPLPWQPAHEAPGWWELLLRRYFPSAEQLRCGSWDEVIQHAQETGPDTQGVVWVRRAIGGTEVSGHLLYVHNNNGSVVFLDGMIGGLARLGSMGVLELVFARFRPGAPQSAEDFGAARLKAEEWLRRTYEESVELVAPDPADETARGWLFACQTTAALRGGDWRHAMLDAGVVVPKGPGAPFLLPNSDPWGFFARWDRGEPAGPTPEPGRADWFASTMGQLGPVIQVSEFSTIADSVRALAALPAGGRALVWVRRLDGRGRESTGLLLTGLHSEVGFVGLVDGSAEEFKSLDGLGECGVRVIRYR